MSSSPLCWVLNLDAENELETRGSYTPSAHMLEITARQRNPLLGTLLQEGDVLLTEENVDFYIASGALRGWPGIAWCPTPRALAQLSAVGAVVDDTLAPSRSILRKVNARPFLQNVRPPLIENAFQKTTATHLDDALAQVSLPARLGWLVRRSFGAAGRGRRRIASGKPGSADLAWLEASLRSGPLTIEPFVEVTREFTRSGWISPQGQVSVAPPCFQETTPAGAWTKTTAARSGEMGDRQDYRLAQAVVEVGQALSAAGYYGPYGIDAFAYRNPQGTDEILNPVSEINARFTMDWSLGMGTRQPHRR